MLKNIIGKTVTKVEITWLERNLPSEITITFNDKSTATFTAGSFCDYHSNFIIVGEFQIIHLSKEK